MLEQIIERLKSSPASDKLVQYVQQAATKINGGKEVVLSEDLQTLAMGAFVIFLGFATTRMLKIFLNVLFGLDKDVLKADAPTKVIIEFENSSYDLEFTKDDYSNEATPSNGVTVLPLKFLVSKLLTPKIYESKNKAAALASQIINPNQFTLTFKGEKLTEDTKSLLGYGIKTNDKIQVVFNTPKQIAEGGDSDEDSDSDPATQGRKRTRNKAKKAKKAKKGNHLKKKNKKSSSPAVEKEYGDFPEPVVKPLTPTEEIDKVMSDLEKDIVPLVDAFINDTPKDKAARDEEHHRLTELLLLKMFAMDGIDAVEPEVRQHRKDAINKMHKHLSALDKAQREA